MKKAIWFSRHLPSREQIEDAARMGYDLIVTAEGTTLGSMDLRDDGDVLACVSGLLGHCAETGAVAIFGVFAAPILAQLARTSEDIRQRGECVEPDGGKGDYPCYAAWNVMRSVEGEKPTFLHRQWLGIGRLNQESCRWLNWINIRQPNQESENVVLTNGLSDETSRRYEEASELTDDQIWEKLQAGQL